MTTPADIIAALDSYDDHALYNELVRRDALRCDYELGAVKDPDPAGDWVACEAHPEMVHEAVVQRDAAGYDIVARDPRPATCPTCGSDRPALRSEVQEDQSAGGPCWDPWHGEER